MIFLTAILLFIYNVLLVNLVRYIEKIFKGLPKGEYSTDSMTPLIWVMNHIPSSNELVKEGHDIWYINLVINSFILLPAIIQHRYFSIPLAIILTWNVFIFQSMFTVMIALLWMLWWSSLTLHYYMGLILIGFMFNIMHIILIVDTMGLQSLLDPKMAQNDIFNDFGICDTDSDM